MTVLVTLVLIMGLLVHGACAQGDTPRPLCNICKDSAPTDFSLANPGATLGSLNGLVITCQDAQIEAFKLGGAAGYTEPQCDTAQTMAVGVCGCPYDATTGAGAADAATTPESRLVGNTLVPFCSFCLSGNPNPNNLGGFIAGQQCASVKSQGESGQLTQSECGTAQLLADAISDPCGCRNGFFPFPTPTFPFPTPTFPVPTPTFPGPTPPVPFTIPPVFFPTPDPTPVPTPDPTPQPTPDPTPEPTPQSNECEGIFVEITATVNEFRDSSLTVFNQNLGADLFTENGLPTSMFMAGFCITDDLELDCFFDDDDDDDDGLRRDLGFCGGRVEYDDRWDVILYSDDIPFFGPFRRLGGNAEGMLLGNVIEFGVSLSGPETNCEARGCSFTIDSGAILSGVDDEGRDDGEDYVCIISFDETGIRCAECAYDLNDHGKGLAGVAPATPAATGAAAAAKGEVLAGRGPSAGGGSTPAGGSAPKAGGATPTAGGAPKTAGGGGGRRDRRKLGDKHPVQRRGQRRPVGENDAYELPRARRTGRGRKLGGDFNYINFRSTGGDSCTIGGSDFD